MKDSTERTYTNLWGVPKRQHREKRDAEIMQETKPSNFQIWTKTQILKLKILLKSRSKKPTNTVCCCCCCSCWVASVVSDSVRPHRWQHTRLPRPWDSPGKNTGVGCHVLLQCMKVKSESEVAQSGPTLSDPMDCSLPGFSVHGIFQARVLEWGAIAFSKIQTDLYQFYQTQILTYLRIWWQ